MSKRTILPTMILMTACLLVSGAAIAQESQVIHFQGILTGPDGGRLRTDIYDVQFSIWDQESGGIDALWSETQAVEVTDGLFDVFLGDVNALSPDVFTYAEGESELRYLQIQVSGDDPMTPRTQIGKTPNSFVSSRVLGDVQTGQGFIRMTVPPDDIHPVAEIMADDDNGITSFKMSTPPDPVMPAIEMIADGSAQSGNIRMSVPPDDQTPAIDLFATASDNITSFKMSIPPNDQTPVFDVELDGVNDRTKVRLGVPPNDIMPGVELSADGASNVYSFKLSTPPDDQTPEISMSSDATTGTGNIRMSVPPDDQHPAFEVSADALLDRISMKLAVPPDDIMPAFEMTKQATGNLTNFRMAVPPNDQLPAFDMTADGDNSITSFRLSVPPDDIMPAIEMTSNGITNESKIRMGVPPDDIMPAVEITTDMTQMAKMRLGVPPDDQTPALEFSSDALSHSGTIRMGVPPNDQYPAVEIAVDQQNNKRLFRLSTPPDDIMPAMEMASGVNENSFRMASPVAGGLRTQIDNPVVEISTGLDNVGSIYMFNPQPEPPAVLTSIVSSMEGPSLSMYEPSYDGQGDLKFDVFVSAQGASISLSDEIGKYMGLDPSPFVDGGFLYMYDPASEDSVVSLGSNGHIWAHNGNFGSNTSTGANSMAVGTNNVAAGDNSFAGGQVAQANHDNCFVWSDYPFGPSVSPTQTSGDNQFLVRATGGVAFYSNASFTTGVSLSPGSSHWDAIVPPGPDLNIRDVDGEQILARIGQLPMKHYSHTGHENGVEHIGPLPGDFNRLFGSTQDDTRISMQDESGVALAAVQALLERIEQLEARIAELEAERR
jgi:hypothetical protein